MQLHYNQESGQGAPVVILHGLYGNQGNWSSHARQLAEHYAVYAFDARNHGQSAHVDSMLLTEMATDVADTMTALGLDSAHLLGHSMGGKIAMLLALQQPQRVRSLIVVDIAPVDYHKPHDDVIQAMLALDLATLPDRASADQQLAGSIPEKPVRDFLLANLQRDADAGFRWRMNLDVIARSFSEITSWPNREAVYDGEVLFIRGENSDYILADHQQETVRQFPQASVMTVSGAGHWVHSEKPEAVFRLISNFLEDQT